MDIKLKDEKNNSFHLRSRAIIKKDNKILLINVDKKDYWFIPGGHAEIGETSEQTLIREIKEEIGVDIKINKLAFIHEQIYKKDNLLNQEIVFFYLAESLQDIKEGEHMEIDKGVEKIEIVKFFSVEEIKELKVIPKKVKEKIINNNLDIFEHIIENNL